MPRARERPPLGARLRAALDATADAAQNGYRAISPADFKMPSLTAAATRVTKTRAGDFRRLEQPWQRRALQYYEMTPEAHFAATYQGNMMSQVRLYVAKIDGTEREEIDDEKIVAYLDRVHDPGSPERSELQRSFGRLMLLTGEGYLLASGTGDEDEPEAWEFVSTSELRVDADGRLRRFKAPGGAGVVYEVPADDVDSDEAFKLLDDMQAVAYRMWRPSPKHSAMADSPMQGVLDLFEELLLLQMAVRARVRSRLSSAGLLILDESISLPALDGRADQANPREDRLMKMMIDHMMKPIADEGSASAVVPFMLRTAVEEGRSIKDLALHLRFSDPNETYRETGLRTECIERIATGMDFPADILKGTGDMTHWNAWQVDEQVAKTLIFPICGLLCANITDSYLRPALKADNVKDWQDYVVWYDPAAIIAHPDQSAAARELYDRGELTGLLLRDAHGWSGEEDKPDDEEVIEWMAKDKRDPVLFKTGEPAPEPMLGPDGMPLPLKEGEIPPTNGQGPNQPQEKDAAMTQKKPPPTPVAASAAPILTTQILGASEAALDRARELAGSRLRPYQRRCGECFEGLEAVPNTALVAALGQDGLEKMEAPAPTELVAGATRTFQATLRRMGLTDEWAATIGDAVEAHAARTLLEEEPGLPASFVNLVTRTERA